MPESRPPEIVSAGTILSSRELKSRFRIGEQGWRKMRRNGLKTVQIGKTCLVTGDEFIRFCAALEEQEGRL